MKQIYYNRFILACYKNLYGKDQEDNFVSNFHNFLVLSKGHLPCLLCKGVCYASATMYPYMKLTEWKV